MSVGRSGYRVGGRPCLPGSHLILGGQQEDLAASCGIDETRGWALLAELVLRSYYFFSFCFGFQVFVLFILFFISVV